MTTEANEVIEIKDDDEWACPPSDDDDYYTDTINSL
jgi:hypothetical protein